MKRRRSTRAKPARDTPVLGPRRRPTKVRPIAPGARGSGTYDPGVPEPRPRNPWVDEGEPEPNG
jgi:hypothetical protein